MARNLELHDANARKIWNFLIESASTPEFKKTYGDVQKATGVHGGTQGLALEMIQIYCHEFDLPHLTAIVVRKSTGIPSSGCDVDLDDIDAQFAKVKDFNWPQAPDSFLTHTVLEKFESQSPGQGHRDSKFTENEPNFWLLQVNPNKWDIATYVNEGNKIDYWSIVNNKRLIKSGDNFILWQTGTNGGVLGWGCFTGDAVDPKNIDSRFWNTDISGRAEFFGILMAEFNLDVSLTRDQMKSLPSFSNSILFRSPQSANAIR